MSNPIDLTTTDAVYDWLEQTLKTDVATVQDYITRFSQIVLTETGRSFLSGWKTYTERYNGNGSNLLQLRNYPVLGVTSLTVGQQTIPQSTDYVQPGWAIDPTGSEAAVVLIGGTSNGITGWQTWGSGWPGWVGGYSFYEGTLNVGITYTAGYLLTAISESHTVPGSSPYTITATNAGTYYADLGATNQSGASLAGQYTVANGVFTFNASLAGQAIYLNYQYGGVPYDLKDAATESVATLYRRRQWMDQTSVNQPGVGTTSYSRLPIPELARLVIERYKMRFMA
jgi:hypothetical protein